MEPLWFIWFVNELEVILEPGHVFFHVDDIKLFFSGSAILGLFENYSRLKQADGLVGG
jgi:hypothetical protein